MLGYRAILGVLFLRVIVNDHLAEVWYGVKFSFARRGVLGFIFTIGFSHVTATDGFRCCQELLHISFGERFMKCSCLVPTVGAVRHILDGLAQLMKLIMARCCCGGVSLVNVTESTDVRFAFRAANHNLSSLSVTCALIVAVSEMFLDVIEIV